MRSLSLIPGLSILAGVFALTACGSPSQSASDEPLATAESPLEESGSVQFYVKIDGQKQGAFPGEATAAAYKGQIPAFQFLMGESEPTDIATGEASGKLQQEAIKFTKAWGAADVAILSAMSDNENLPTVVFTFLKTDATGKASTLQTVKLTNAHFTDVERGTLQVGTTTATSILADDISIAYQKITVTDSSGATWSEDWGAVAATVVPVVTPLPKVGNLLGAAVQAAQ